jgi:hypothetical protein
MLEMHVMEAVLIIGGGIGLFAALGFLFLQKVISANFPRIMGVIALQAVIGSGMIALLLIAGFAAQELSVQKTHDNAECVVRALEKYNSQHGCFPESMEKLRSWCPDLPRPTMTEEFMYSIRGQGFILEYPNNELFGTDIYDSNTSTWK